MSTFAKTSFDAARYMAMRPTYPRQLYDMIYRFHETGSIPQTKATSTIRLPSPRWNRAIDLGCGTGQATVELTPFKHVTGVDPGEKMLASAREYMKSLQIDQINQVDFVQSYADALGFVKDDTVDLVIAAQACHWFDWDKQWIEMHRILRPGGTLAFWGYSEFRVAHHPELTPLVAHYSSGTDRATALGEYWERPGRTIVEELLYPVPDPKPVEQWLPLQRVYFSGPHAPHLTPSLPIIMQKTYSWDDFLDWLRTWSSLHTFNEAHPDKAGDLELEFMMQLKEGLAKAGRREEEGIQVEWPLAVLLTKKL